MAEVTGLDVLNSGVRGAEITTLDFSNLIYSYGRDYFSKFKPFVTSAGPQMVNNYGYPEENFKIESGSAKKIVGVHEITLDEVRYGGQPIGTGAGELRPGLVPLSVRLMVARQFGKIFALDDKDLLDLGKDLPGILDKALMQAYGKAVDKTIVDSLTAPIPSIVYDKTNPNAWYYQNGSRKFLAKYTATHNKANFVYRDGTWTSGSTVGTARFGPSAVYKIEGFFIDKGISGYRPVCMQLTPAAIDILAATNEGLRMLRDGGTDLIQFVKTQTTLAAGESIRTNNLGPASAYAAANDVIDIAARTIGDDHTSNEGVLFPPGQNMTAAQLNTRPNVSGFDDIQLTRDNLIAVWAKDAIAFGEFNQLMNNSEDHDPRQKNALYRLTRFGMNACILDENKVMLFPIRGKNK